MPRFNHIVRNIPNTPENRQSVKDLNKIACKSKSKWRLHIKYRQPKENCKWGWGGTLACKDADGFSVYLKNIIPYEERPEVTEKHEMRSKYYKLLDKYNELIMNQIVDKLKEDIDSYDLCTDWRNVKRTIERIMLDVHDGFRQLEGSLSNKATFVANSFSVFFFDLFACALRIFLV